MTADVYTGKHRRADARGVPARALPAQAPAWSKAGRLLLTVTVSLTIAHVILPLI